MTPSENAEMQALHDRLYSYCAQSPGLARALVALMEQLESSGVTAADVLGMASVFRKSFSMFATLSWILLMAGGIRGLRENAEEGERARASAGASTREDAEEAEQNQEHDEEFHDVPTSPGHG